LGGGQIIPAAAPNSAFTPYPGVTRIHHAGQANATFAYLTYLTYLILYKLIAKPSLSLVYYVFSGGSGRSGRSGRQSGPWLACMNPWQQGVWGVRLAVQDQVVGSEGVGVDSGTGTGVGTG
jgi:hypothetical protein